MSTELAAELAAVMAALSKFSDHALAEKEKALYYAANRAWRELDNLTRK